jgi:hypothetical protein
MCNFLCKKGVHFCPKSIGFRPASTRGFYPQYTGKGSGKLDRTFKITQTKIAKKRLLKTFVWKIFLAVILHVSPAS